MPAGRRSPAPPGARAALNPSPSPNRPPQTLEAEDTTFLCGCPSPARVPSSHPRQARSIRHGSATNPPSPAARRNDRRPGARAHPRRVARRVGEGTLVRGSRRPRAAREPGARGRSGASLEGLARAVRSHRPGRPRPRHRPGGAPPRRELDGDPIQVLPGERLGRQGGNRLVPRSLRPGTVQPALGGRHLPLDRGRPPR